MIRWVLLLLLGLNLVYLAFGFYRAQDADPYSGVEPFKSAPHAAEIQLIDALADSPPPAEPSFDP